MFVICKSFSWSLNQYMTIFFLDLRYLTCPLMPNMFRKNNMSNKKIENSREHRSHEDSLCLNEFYKISLHSFNRLEI